GNAPITFVMGTEMDKPLVRVRFAVTIATTPLPIVVLFDPLAMHRTEPLAELHCSVFPAAVKAGPATAVSDRRSVSEYDIVHCKLAGAFPDEVNERFNGSEPPGMDVPDPRVREF